MQRRRSDELRNQQIELMTQTLQSFRLIYDTRVLCSVCLPHLCEEKMRSDMRRRVEEGGGKEEEESEAKGREGKEKKGREGRKAKGTN